MMFITQQKINMIELKLIKINKLINTLRILGVIMILLPVPLHSIQITDMPDFWAYWFFVWLILFIIQYYLLKRYKIEGRISLSSEEIVISPYAENPKTFIIDTNLRISIRYKGYKYEKGNYQPYQIPIFSKEGIGTLIINNNDDYFRYNFLSEKNYNRNLIKLSEAMELKGCKCDVVWD